MSDNGGKKSMQHTRLEKCAVGAGLVLSFGIFGKYMVSSSTTMGSETERAGMAYMLDQYCTIQVGATQSNPEAIVACEDKPGNTNNGTSAVSGSAVSNATPEPTKEATATATPKPESEYAFAKDDHTLRILLRLARDEEYESVSILYNNKYDFTRYRYSGEMSKEFSDELFDYYAFEIKLNDVRFAYIFVLRKGRKVWYYSEEGISEEYDFERAYYTFYQYPYINSADVVRVTEWAYKAIFYQIFVDRFYRGDYKKDDSYITQEWRDRIGAKSYAGGDLKGITQKLPYLKDLGVNALYLTPVLKANSNHKYNTTDYRTVES